MVGDKATLQTNTVRFQAGRVKGGAYLATWVLPHLQVRVPSTSRASQDLAPLLSHSIRLKHSAWRSTAVPPLAHCSVSRSLPNIPFYIHVTAFSMPQVGLDILRDRLNEHFVCQSAGVQEEAQPGIWSE